MRRFAIRKKWYHDLFGKHRHKATFVAAFLVFVGVIGFILASTSITDITPDRGPSTGGQTIVITGSGFTDYVAGTPTNFTSTGCQVWTAPADGYYQLETWGAQGGNAGANAGGRGGYSTGTVYLAAGTQAWACVGGQGAQASRTPSTPQPGGANGGGGAYRTDNGNGREVATGGGGTDIRLNINSLYSRVIVAGGGGGASGNQWGTVPGGFGGGLTGGISTTAIGQPGGGGTQTAGGTNSATGCDGAGAFGAAFNCVFSTAVNAAGGGGGWFGGGSGLPGGGGSGFVHTSSNTPNSSTIGGQYLLGELHQMFNTGMADGGSSGSMPAPNGGTQTGQSGNGYARITQLPYFVTVGGTPCREVNILSDTQLSCVTPAHSASDAVVVVTIGDSTYTTGAGSANGGYTFTDALNISGPAALSGSNSGTYTVTLDYNYTGTVTLSDGGLGGTFSGANVVGGNQLVYSNQASRTFTYTPALGYQGDVVIVADSGNDYVSNGQITVTITTFATSFDMQCFADGSWTTNPFINPGTPLDCQIALNGAYDGVIDLTDFASTEIGDLGGSFTSTDSRFSAAAFNLSASDTINPSGQVLAFTYTSPTWSYLIDNLYEDDNGYMLFWPTLIATSSPNLNPAQQSVSVGLLAQAYEIYSLDTPPIGQNHGCTGCVARFGLSTFNAPYFGSITLSSDLAGNFDSGSGVLSPTLNISFSGSGNDETFRYTPDVIGEHTISGASGGPAVADSDISFNVIDSHILLTCTPSSVARGQSANCELSVNPADLNPGLVVSLQDLFLSYSLPQASGDGVFTDTSAITGTFSGGTYSFCGGIGGADCIGETYDRTFTYTLPLDTDSGYAVVRIQADSNDGTTTDSNWALLNIIPDTMEMYCSDLSPDCQTARVGALQDYIIQPNGMFAGTVQISDGDPYSIFSDNGIASWNFSADEFDFEYTPGSTGLKTITATVLTVDDPSSGIKVGDTYTFDVMVVADTITISGPDTVARDEVPSTPRFAITMNGPFVGTISGRIVRQDGAATIQFTSSVLVGTSNFTDNGNGTFSCSVTLANYNEATNTTTACMADSGAAEGFIFDYNWFEIQAQVTADPSIAPAAKTVGLVANRYAVTLDGSDATAGTIIATLGTPLTFTLTPNALFAGTYSFDDAGNGGYFLPLSGNIVRTQSQWPAFNNQTMQTAEFTYVPQETGYVTITVNALREAGLAPAGAAAMGEQTITLLVIADSLAIKGPATLVRGQLGAYTLELNGPYIGSVALSDNLEEDLNGDSVVDNEHHIRWPSDPDTLIPIGQAVCDFTLADYDEANNTTSCEFLFIVTDDSHYTNTADIFAATSEISTTATISIIADGFDVAPGPELNNQKINTPIEFTITPNAQFDGEFDITMVSPPVLDSGGIHYCPSPADFSGAFSPDHIDYAYSDYLTVGQDPVTRSFTFTPASFGRACFLVTPTASDGRTIAPQMIMVHTLDDMTLGGPTTMTRSPDGDTDSPTFTLSINGEYDGQVDFSLWNPITDSEISGAVITSDDGGASCTFVHDDVDDDTEITSCELSFVLPSTFTGNRIQLRATAGATLPSMTHDIAIVASSFTVSPPEVLNASLDTPVAFTITPDSLFAGTFTLSDDSGLGLFDTTTVTFTEADWPTDGSAMPGKTFYYSPERYGYNQITVTNSTLGTEYASILVLADTMSLTGSNSIQIASEMIGLYTLNIHGPYTDRINLTIHDAATGVQIAGATVQDANGADGTYCEGGDYNSITNITPCSFSVTLPSGYTGSKHIIVRATVPAGSRPLSPNPAETTTAITANDYSLTPNTRQVITLGETVSFAITPNSVFAGSFNIMATSGAGLSVNSVSFAATDWPLSSNANVTKSFTATPTATGRYTISVSDPFTGTPREVEIVVVAGSMSMTGTSSLPIADQMIGYYTLTLDGPYVGQIDLSVYDAVTEDAISGATIEVGTSGLAYCDESNTTYSVATNQTTCQIAVTLPSNYSDSRHVVVQAATAPGSPAIPSASVTTAILANDFTLSPSGTQIVVVGQTITFTVTPNSIFEGAFSISTDGGSTLSDSSLSFSAADWTAGSNLNPSKTFTVTATAPGVETLTVTSSLGTKTVTIDTIADGMGLTGTQTIPIAPTMSGNYRLVIPGPYVGTINFSATDPAASGAAITVAAFSNGGSCTVSDGDYGTVVPGATICDFTITLPANYSGSHFMTISAETDTASPPLTLASPLNVAITANDYTLSPATEQIGIIGTPINFTITPNSVFGGNFNVTSSGTGSVGVNTPTVGFSLSDFPTDSSDPVGKQFTVTPTAPGIRTISVSNPFGGAAKTVDIVTFATTISLDGPGSIQLDTLNNMTAAYTLIIPGPYAGTVNLSLTDLASGSAIAGASLSSGTCVLTVAADYNAATNQTSCNFTATLPAGLDSNRILVTAISDSGSPALAEASRTTLITASGYTLSPDTAQTGTIGTPLTFTVTPDAIYDGSFTISTSGTSKLSTGTLSFSPSDYPTDSNANIAKTFTVTPTAPGVETITITSPLGTKTVEITTFATQLDITGAARIQRGQSGNYTLVINGPYNGTATISAYIPQQDGTTSVPATDVVLSRTTCDFTVAADYDAATNTTTCAFTASVPQELPLNYIGLTATAPGLEGDPTVAITASDFEFSSATTEGQVGTPITFTITPDGLYEGIFNLSDGGMGGSFSPGLIAYDQANWPASHDHTLPAGVTFTYTPVSAGSVTITVTGSDETSGLLGTKHITLTIAEATKPPVEPPTEPEAPPTSDRIRSSDTVRNIGFIAGITALLAAITFVALKLKRIRRF